MMGSFLEQLMQINRWRLVMKGIFIFVITLSLWLQSSSSSKAQSGGLYNMSYLFFNSLSSYVTQVDQTKGSLRMVSPNYFDVTSDGKLDITWKLQTSFISEMHRRGIKVVPFLANHWDITAGINGLKNRDQLARDVAAAIEQYNLDGVDVDIEGLGTVYKDAHTDFIRLLRQYIPSNKEVSVAVAANPNNWKTGWQGFYDYPALAQIANYLMIMAYDESWESTESPIGPVSSISFFERSVQFAINSGVPREKIVCGLPFYGRMWKLDGPTLENKSITGMGIGINRVEQLTAQFNGSLQFDEKTQSAFAKFTIPSGMYAFIGSTKLTEGDYIIWYDNEKSIKTKLLIPVKYGIKGTGSWALSLESPSMWDYYSVWLNGQNLAPFWVDNGMMGLTNSDNVNLLDIASENGKIVRTLPRDVNVKIVGASANNWYPVQLSDGTEGFINSTSIDPFQRFSGKDRFEVAGNIAKMGWQDSADTVFLSNYNAFADALAASPLAYAENAPILLTQRDALNTETQEVIKGLNPKKVIIIGGTGSVGNNVVTALQAMGINTIDRIGGKDRFEVSANIAKRLGLRTTAIVADGMNFPDALSIAPYAARNGFPILLANKNILPTQTKDALTTQGIQQTIVVGGEASVGSNVYNQLPVPKRISGKDRYEVSVNVIRDLNLSPQSAFIATGLSFADALTGSVLAAKLNAPLLLTNPTQLPTATKEVITKKGIIGFNILGGLSSVGEPVYNALR
jgi:spore germination protein YaaH/putative cell wall-binding protein